MNLKFHGLLPILSFISKKRAFIVGGVVVLGMIWFLFFRGGGVVLETLIVHRQDFTEQVSISGTVEAANDADLGFSQSGRVTHLYAKVGDQVRMGALIAQIENADLQAMVLQKQAALGTAEAQLASLQEGTRPEEIAIAEADVASDEAALFQANQALLNAMQNAYSVAGSIAGNTIDQFFVNAHSSNPKLSFASLNSDSASAAEASRLSAERALSSWDKALAPLSASSDLTTVSQQSLQNLSLVFTLLTHANTALNYAVPGQASASSISAWVSDVNTARATVNTAIATLTSGVTAQKAASATLIKDQKDLILKKAGTTKSDVDAQLASVAAARADVARAKAELAKTIIAAPFSGVITKMDVKIGEVASPNATSITIQSADIFHAVTYVPEVNVASVAVGNDASITLDAYGTDTLFPAKVIAIDPAETLKEGIATYKTTLIFNDADARIKSGMTANVKIATKERPQVIVIPQGAVHVVDGQSFVTKSVRGTFSEVLVTIGSTSSLGQVEVFSGLEEGDVIAFSASGE